MRRSTKIKWSFSAKSPRAVILSPQGVRIFAIVTKGEILTLRLRLR